MVNVNLDKWVHTLKPIFVPKIVMTTPTIFPDAIYL